MAPEADLSRYAVLAVDDEQDNLDIIRFNFKKNHPLHFATSGQAGLDILKDHDVACIVADQRMPGMSGLDFLKAAHGVRPDAVSVLLTAYADLQLLAEALNSGLVYRYVAKPWSSEELGHAIRGAVEHFHLVRENRRLLEKLAEQNAFLLKEQNESSEEREIVGEAAALKRVMETVKQVAPTPSTVLLRGESGAGKELVARAIHNASPRASKPFVRVNCAALAPGVLESELFGHEKGAFTGALARKLGRFELADEGSIFLDEVGDLSPEIQVKLLRVLQEREFERVGGTETLKVDVRVISATNRNLEELIEDGLFREDLYYRLNVFPVTVPPLRERSEDVELLAKHFVRRFGKRCGKPVETLTEPALAKLREYNWPGNVRELENVIERAVILCKSTTLDEADLDFGPRKLSGPPPANLTGALEDLEKRKLLETMEKHRGRKADVARELGVNRSTLYYRLKKYGLE
jgi:two-component system, NtrC family, response regulator AtoC